MKGLEIAPFLMEHREALLALWQACGILAWDPAPKTTIHKKVSHSPEGFLIGMTEGNLVASLIVGYDGLRGWLYRLAVLPGYRHRGIARALVEHAENWLRDQGCVRVKLQVEPRGQDAVGFYRELGYEQQELLDMHKWLVKPESA
ncbi:MAG: GNAT family acetyltransferase [candidate division WOR-3 bacterium]|nr:MAG: GNAT family acetyltransferase [candidate division WOR-3 bacterium]